jgi:hypothetical protein
MQLIDERTVDGSRCFVRLPYFGKWQSICQHVLLLSNNELITATAINLWEGVLRFRFRNHQFRLTCYGGELCLVVSDPLCFDLLLHHVACHFSEISDQTVAQGNENSCNCLADDCENRLFGSLRRWPGERRTVIHLPTMGQNGR